MSTKFFTWTKGDRKNIPDALRTSGVVPIPAECISIKGFDYGRSTKRPNNLHAQSPVFNLDENVEPLSKHNSNSSTSLALHDAAVQSATSLMAVMNDMLRSPPMSAHLFSQTYPPRLSPMHGRPRSRTAPPTPLVEAPATNYVELPGSFHFDLKPEGAMATASKAEDLSAARDLATKIGDGLPRPHSSPQHGVNSSGIVPCISSPWLSPLPMGTPSQRQETFHAQITSPSLSASTTNQSASHLQPVSADQPELGGSTPFPSSCSAKANSLPASLATSRSVSANQVARVQAEYGQKVAKNADPDGNGTMFEEVASLRKSHEAHVESLKVAHQQEISSYKSYVALLENRQNELCWRQSEQIQDNMKKAGENERNLMNTITDLEARLEAANNERTDVLEGYHDACARLRTFSQQDTDPVLGMTAKPRHIRAASEACRFEATTPPMWQQAQDLRRVLASKDVEIQQLQNAASIQSDTAQVKSAQMKEIQEALDRHKEMLASARADSERYNSLLHHEIRRQTRGAVNSTPRNTPNIEAEAFVIATEKMLRIKAQRTHSASESQTSGGSATQSSTPSDVLERELEQCIREIIMYKMDVKALRKDLRKAQAKIDSLQAVHTHRPPTPDGESAASNRSHSSPEFNRIKLARPSPNENTPTPTQPGLGITFAERKARSSESGASPGLSSPAHPYPASTTSSPLPRSRTPLGIHKKLPKPPISPRQYPLPTSPPPSNGKLERNATQRSVSESIISFYAQRLPGQ